MQAGGNNVTGATVTVNGDVLTVTNLARLDQTDPSCRAWRRPGVLVKDVGLLWQRIVPTRVDLLK
jgi:hypothetical protein